MKIINVCYNNYERRDNMSLNILYEDNHIIVVEKPSGILSQADHTNDIDMLTLIKRYIKERYQKPGNVYLGLVHRLDRMTSGVMVFAKTSKAASRLNEQNLKHEFVKKYYAVVKGIVPKTGNLKNYLYNVGYSRGILRVGSLVPTRFSFPYAILIRFNLRRIAAN